MAHNTTVKAEAARLGNKAAISWADHIIETLEGNLKSEREHLYQLAKAVVEKNYMAEHIARAVIQLHELREKQEKESV
jgi:hypothetical protein